MFEILINRCSERAKSTSSLVKKTAQKQKFRTWPLLFSPFSIIIARRCYYYLRLITKSNLSWTFSKWRHEYQQHISYHPGEKPPMNKSWSCPILSCLYNFERLSKQVAVRLIMVGRRDTRNQTFTNLHSYCFLDMEFHSLKQHCNDPLNTTSHIVGAESFWAMRVDRKESKFWKTREKAKMS